MIPTSFLMLLILTGRLGIKKITISMRRETHDTQTVYHPMLTGRSRIKNITISMRRKTQDNQTVYHSSNTDWQVRYNEDHHQYEEEDPCYQDCFSSSQY